MKKIKIQQILILIGLTKINILGITDSNTFSYRHKIGEFKHIDIKYLVNNIKNNTINEISTKKGLNTLNELKNAGITKQKKRTPKQKELLNLFNDLSDTILADKALMSSKDEDKNAKNKKTTTDTKKDENKIILLEYIEEVDDKFFLRDTVTVKVLTVL